MRLLYQILWKDHSRVHLLGAFLGTLAGFVLLLAGIQFYMDLKAVLSENRDLLDPEYIVIPTNFQSRPTPRVSKSLISLPISFLRQSQTNSSM